MHASSSSLVCDLARWLLAEPYARACNFATLTLGEVCQQIEEELEGNLDGAELAASYLRCRAELALLLADYELRGIEEFPEEFLYQLAELESAESRPSLFLDAANYFKNLRAKHVFALNPLLLDRLVIQHLCFAVEERAVQTLGPALAEFWEKRGESIQRLLDPAATKLCLNSQLREGLETLARTHEEWLEAGRLPFHAIFNSLRYLFSLNDQKRFQPSAFEMGTLILLFGQDEEVGGFALKNELRLQGLMQSEVLELAFRLFRIQKLKSMVLKPRLEFEPIWNQTAEEDAQRIIYLFEALERALITRRVA